MFLVLDVAFISSRLVSFRFVSFRFVSRSTGAVNMFRATRSWFRRNRTPIAIGVGVVGAGYLATQYVLAKINDARERMGSDRIAKEKYVCLPSPACENAGLLLTRVSSSLRRRFEQNQEDCTFTVLALLPTATTNILEAMNTEQITLEIQQLKAASKSPRGGESSGPPPSIADTTMTDEEGRSTAASLQSDSGVHTSQMGLPTASQAGDGVQDGGQATPATQKQRRTKRQMWDDLTISG